MIERTYTCDICRNKREPEKLIGMDWVDDEYIECKSENAKLHLCFRCISTIQNMEHRCRQGFKCNGGPRCSSSHK